MGFFAQVMIAGLVGLGAVGMFNRRPLVLHCIVCALYIFRYELTNKITFMLLVSFAAVHLTRETKLGKRRGVAILGLGFILFFSRGLSFLFYRVDDLGLVFRETAVSYVNAVVWAYLLFATVRKARDIMTILGVYALMRGIESGLGGLLLYHFPDTALQFVLEKRNLTVEAESTLAAFSRDERLMSLAGMNPVDTSYHLALSITFFCGRLASKIRWIEVFAVVVCVASLLYTWSRTGWVGLALSMGLFAILLYSPRVWTKYAAVIGLLLGLIYFSADTIQERYYSDNRNMAESTLLLRFTLQKQYMAKVLEYGLFGVGLPNPQIPAHLGINPPISSESMIISALVETGWIGVTSFLVLLVYITQSSFRSLLRARRDRNTNPETYYVSVTLFASFIISLIMSLSFYLSWSDPITWLLIGLVMAHEKLLETDNRAAAPSALDLSRHHRIRWQRSTGRAFPFDMRG